MVNIYDTIEETININRQTAESKKVTFHNKLSAQLFVKADQEHLNSVLRNLASNAIKFSHEGGKVIFCARQEEESVVICVKDQGIGIQEERLKDIFHAGSTTWGTAGEKGTGLGLALCKEFVEQNRGKIWVSSKVGSGSTFFIAFPSNVNPSKTQPSALSNATL